MSVEGGSGGGVGGVAGAAFVSGAAILEMPSLEAAPVVVNEGPVRSLEGFRPMNASDINTIDFKGGTIAPGQPLVIAQAEEVAAAAWEKSELPTSLSEAAIVPNVTPAWMPDQLVQPLVIPQILPITSTIVEDNDFLAVNPLLEPAAKTELSPKTGTRVLGRVSPAVSPQPFLQEQEVEEIVMEKVKVEEPKESLEEEEIVDKKLFLEDEKASAVRKFEIQQAIKLVKLSTIVGSLVARFLPGEHEGNRSSALKGKGPDGSYEETVEAIASSGEFSSEKQAEKRFEEIVDEKKPIKDGKNGNPVANSVVARVFKFRAKPLTAIEIFVKRIVKKTQSPVRQVAVETKTETSLEDYPELAEVFPG